MQTSYPSAAVDGAGQGSSDSDVVERDGNLFLDWDFAFIQVENVMFKIPRQPLVNLETLGLLLTQGSSEASPIVLPDIKATEFRTFLHMLYPAFLSKTDNAFEKQIYGEEEWLSVLKLSTKFRCLKQRKEAIRCLELVWSLVPNVTKMIQIGREASVEKWVADGYKRLVSRGECISDDEMLGIGPVQSFQLMRLREECRRSSRHSAFMADTVRAKFVQELTSISAEEKIFDEFDEEK